MGRFLRWTRMNTELASLSRFPLINAGSAGQGVSFVNTDPGVAHMQKQICAILQILGFRLAGWAHGSLSKCCCAHPLIRYLLMTLASTPMTVNTPRRRWGASWVWSKDVCLLRNDLLFTWAKWSYIRPQTSALTTRREPRQSLLSLCSLHSVCCHKSWMRGKGGGEGPACRGWCGVVHAVLLCCTWQKPIIWLAHLLKWRSNSRVLQELTGAGVWHTMVIAIKLLQCECLVFFLRKVSTAARSENIRISTNFKATWNTEQKHG